MRLPDAERLASLERLAARAYCAPSHVQAVAGAGSQAFIQLLPQLIEARRVAILGYTYAEHAARWRAAGALVEETAALEELARADVAVIVNPNNPDGRMIAPDRIAELGAAMGRSGRRLIVDEAFMDMTPSLSAAPHVSAGLVVLRSFGKAYGLAGVRLGFALCDEDLASRLREAAGPWSVSGPALATGAAALADSSWLANSAQRLRRDAQRLDEMLIKAGFEIAGGALLFRLAKSERAGDWFRALAERGIWTRRFAERPMWLRFGIPGDESAWRRLEDTLGNAS